MANRKRAEQRGRRAETLAAIALQLKGYRILARRVRNSAGEIDLIAARKNIIAFIEVKARKSHAAASYAVTPKTEQRITRAAELWMARRPDLSQYDWRFDTITLIPRRWPRHIQDAWRPGFRD